MAAATITGIMQGIDTRLGTISGLRHNAYRPKQINPPHAFVVMPSDIDYHHSFAHGVIRLDFEVQLFLSESVDRAGQPALALFMDVAGSSSIHAAIEADRTLGGISGCDCVVLRAVERDEMDFGGAKWYGATFTLRVTAAGA